MVFSCFAVYVPKGAIHDSNYSTTRVLFTSTYTVKQLKTIYYSLNTHLWIFLAH